MKILKNLQNLGFVKIHLKKVTDVKVKDHDHINGKYQGPVHQNLSLTKKIPITFHNLQNYDSHLIFQEVERFNFKINVVPKNKRKLHELYYRTT